MKIFKEPRRAFFKLSKWDIQKLLNASPDYLQHIIAFALLTGLRRSNILNLRWSQIDFERGCVFIAGEQHKSKDHVVTPLCDQALLLLNVLKAQSSSSFAFTNTLGNPVKDIKDKKWKEIITSAELEGLRFHDLRHNWATKHVESGTDLLALKELGGWKTLEMVQRYAHPSDDYLAQQAKNIDGNSQVEESFSKKITVSKPNDELICVKKSTHLDIIEVQTEDYLIIGEAHKLKNLLIINRLDK